MAAPQCTCRLADAGARVIKIERPEGDFARGYDDVVHGESAYFVWLNRGKQSVVLDLAKPDDKALLEAMLAKADVFVQNLKPGAVAKLGFAIERLRHDYPRLICCSISGYGESGPYAQRKAYDMLIQAEAGVASVTGGPEAPARVGVSVVDIAAGMNAYEAILEALIARGRTGEGAAISVSMFDAMADWMTVPLLQHEGGVPPKRIGLAHASISPYGVFKTPRRRRHPDLDPERPRMARAGREGAGRRGARRRSEFRHQSKRVENRDRDRRQGRCRFRRPRCRRADGEARRAPTSPSAASTTGSSVEASASAPHHGRRAERACRLCRRRRRCAQARRALRRGARARRAYGDGAAGVFRVKASQSPLFRPSRQVSGANCR